jgi:hypothetical protein
MAESGGNRKVTRTRDAKASENRDHPLFALRSAVARTTGQVARSYWVSKTGFTGFSTPITQADRTRNRNDNSAYNLAILRHLALNLPQRDLAARRDDFLAQLLFANLKGRHKCKMQIKFVSFCY